MKEVSYTPKGRKEEGWYREAEKFPDSKKIPEDVVISSLSSNIKEAREQLGEMYSNLKKANMYRGKGKLDKSALYLQGIIASIKTGQNTEVASEVADVLKKVQSANLLNENLYKDGIYSAKSDKAKENLYRAEKESKALGREVQRQLEKYEVFSNSDQRKKYGGLEERAVGRPSLPVSAVARAAAIISASGLILGLFFLSPSVTGNAIAQVSTKTSSFVGIGLVIIGIISGIFWAKKK